MLKPERKSNKKLIIGLIAATLVVAGFVSWFASSNPDGLEWSIEKTVAQSGIEMIEQADDAFAQIQQRTSILPDYAFDASANTGVSENGQTSVAGIVGAAMTLGFAALTGFVIWLFKRKKRKEVSAAGD